MSSHLAGALVVFAVLQIGVVARLGGSLLMHLGIFFAIGGFAMAARGLEARWVAFAASAQPRDTLNRLFREDRAILWIASIGAPFLWVPVAMICRTLFG
ncbi:hypothetical protein ENE74_05780 [Sphingobium algorifonticola]|uniref:Uncharacterized protein n=2 Tax=Sphingobium algorifonticola TaxID=2008318 RepID=A0A437JAS4_9SPHN|nr:hypothetical protein ENE74_05780 [Sphingobium algorifonticola]